ncbi:MAG: Coenzyme F420 hydrogenase/dehydrogenase, beta subunit C-terminal domain [Eubacterium sp.]|nr:Coenzyme F420 hydrogenase/dehydrogenase, beta subunit C-terminal domain [Eubacterium sp.]
MELIHREKCYSCGACIDICPKKAISIEWEDGFPYPSVDQSLCINCGLCKRACPAEHIERKNEFLRLYAFMHRDPKVIEESSSGGAFTALSDHILNEGGLVIGAVMDEDKVVRHHIAENITGRDTMRGAKYMKSDMSGVYSAVKEKIQKTQRPVLFSGTPCQAEAFRTFCLASGIDFSNIYICALVCHGAASPLVWKAYLNHLLSEHQGKEMGFSFRDKSLGWRKNQMTARIDGQAYPMRSYSSLFYSKLCNSRACFNCPFASVERNCDITMGDFWSIQRFEQGYEEGKGVSKLLAHTKKGDWLINQCEADGELTRMAYNPNKDSLQPALTKPYVRPVEYELFWKDFQRMKFSKLEKKYAGKDISDRICRTLRRKLLQIGR